MSVSNVLSLLGGLALFIYGMNILGGSLERYAGNRLKGIMAKLTTNAASSFLLGAGFTCIVQSSAATTVMAVGFVNSAIMTLRQTIPLIVGANVGTTVTGWILSTAGISGGAWYTDLLKPATFTPAIAFAGILIHMSSRQRKRRDLASIFLGFSILMFGMQMMSGAVKPLADIPAFTNLLVMFSHPIMGILAGTVIAAAVQSSSAAVGILQALSVTGAIPYSAAIPMFMGMNIGASFPVLLSAIGSTAEAKRTSLIYLVFNVAGTVIWMLVITVANALFPIPLLQAASNPFGIALAHTVYKLLCAMVEMPFCAQMEKLVCLLVPEKQDQSVSMLDERLFVTPGIALGRAHTVLVDMAKLSVKSFLQSLDMISDFDENTAQAILDAENKVDLYEDKLGTFLVQLSSHRMTEEDSRELTKYLRVLSDYERISDHSVNVLYSAREKHEKSIRFSESAWQELGVLRQAVRKILDLSESAFSDNDLAAATCVEPLDKVISDLTAEIKARHVQRLTHGVCSVEIGFVLNDLLANFERVASHCANVAVAVIEIDRNSFDTHQYAHAEVNAKEYRELLDRYEADYNLTGIASGV
ncbi:MAG: Na/Pi cotransporter family protein [Clostridia bacterium]|nr:Na/Pi cotransporter family protein [Clostridia bacterium]MBR6890399.1 Na/Pi cotransporter family protein [Clostridia bacterium]